MKIAVYCCAKNEEATVGGWAQSAKDADVLLLADTGSTDRTREIAAENGAAVHTIGISPWRFDDARNAALALVRADVDICIALDADETLSEGWRERVEMEWQSDWTRARYLYQWSPEKAYSFNRIHRRHGFHYVNPAHESLEWCGEGTDITGWLSIVVTHRPPADKPRPNPLPLLELAVRERPHDARMWHYLTREHGYRKDSAKVVECGHRELALRGWNLERAATMILLGSHSAETQREAWLQRAVMEAPGRREPLVALARHFHDRADWPSCYAAATRALAITERPIDYLAEVSAWGALPHDLAAVSAHWMGLRESAINYGKAALELAPDDTRLVCNLRNYVDAARGWLTSAA